MVGLVHAQAALGQGALLPILHLAHVNPYVTGAMEMGGSQGAWAVARQPGALPAASAADAATPATAIGVSAFAVQGTNALALLASAGGAALHKQAAHWARQRFWVAPRPHAALQRAVPAQGGRQLVVQSAPLASPALAYLWDHRVSGKPLFPGAAFFELAAAAAKTLLGPAGDGAALAGVAIPAPLVLPALGSPAQQQAAPALVCRLEAATGAVEVTSAQRATHLRASLAAVAAMPEPSGSGSTGGRVAAARTALQLRLQHAQHAAAEPAAVAAVDAAADAASDVFLSPAVLDCCLHLGALPAAAAGQLKVPAGIQALLRPGTAAPSIGGDCAAAALQVQSSPAASLIDYSL